MFDEENLISLAIFLSLCLSIHNTYFFLRNFRIIFREMFSFLREIFAFSISRSFLIIFSRSFRIFYFSKVCIFSRNRQQQNSKKKAKIFAFFASERNAKMQRYDGEIFFRKNDFSFLLETLLSRLNIYWQKPFQNF